MSFNPKEDGITHINVYSQGKTNQKPQVWNVRQDCPEDAVYIGRPRGGGNQHFGNPFSHISDSKAEILLGSREEAIRAFDQWLRGAAYQNVAIEQRKWVLEHIHELRGKHLKCWCAPRPCHGDVILKFLEQEVFDYSQERIYKMKIAGTGHRPNKLGGYSDRIFERLVNLSERALRYFKADYVISGMALGFDQALAQAAINLGIPFEAAIPFKGQEGLWPEQSQIRYRELLEHANKISYLFSKPRDKQGIVHCMFRRDEYMVDQCDMVVSLWNGDLTGGTAHTIRYANSVGKPVKNLWNVWVGK